MREAASDVCSTAHERAATKQAARQAAAHPGFDDMAPSAVSLALRICTSYSTRLAPCIRGHLVRNATHEGFCISLPRFRALSEGPCSNYDSVCARTSLLVIAQDHFRGLFRDHRYRNIGVAGNEGRHDAAIGDTQA